jgi:hypothetical protein
MLEDDLLAAIRNRISDPKSRIDLTTAGTPPLLEPAAPGALSAAETELGFALPPLLWRLYLEVGNGGFGPGAGLGGVDGGYTDVDGRTLSAAYVARRSHKWPAKILPLCDLGDGAWSCLDRRGSNEDILTVNAVGVTRTKFALSAWLEAWVSGVDLNAETFEIETGSMTNPFTREPLTVKRRGRAKGILVESFGP